MNALVRLKFSKMSNAKPKLPYLSCMEEGVIELKEGVEWTPYLAKLTYLTLQKVVQQGPISNA